MQGVQPAEAISGVNPLRKQMLGVLFSDRDWKSIWNRTSSEDVDLYVDAATRHGIGVCFFRIRDIDSRTQTVLAMTRT